MLIFMVAIVMLPGWLGGSGAARAELVWDNNLDPDGVAAVPLTAPAGGVADDLHFLAPVALTAFRLAVIEDSGFSAGSRFEFTIYADLEGVPGERIRWDVVPYAREATGSSFFGRPVFVYTVPLGGVDLQPGRYWIGGRNADASGTGMNYWLTSDGGPDGAGSFPSARYLGGAWMPTGYQQAFELHGRIVPEPRVGLFLLLALARSLARRRGSEM